MVRDADDSIAKAREDSFVPHSDRPFGDVIHAVSGVNPARESNGAKCCQRAQRSYVHGRVQVMAMNDVEVPRFFLDNFQEVPVVAIFFGIIVDDIEAQASEALDPGLIFSIHQHRDLVAAFHLLNHEALDKSFESADAQELSYMEYFHLISGYNKSPSGGRQLCNKDSIESISCDILT